MVMRRRKTPGFSRGRRWAKPLDQSTAAQAVRQPGIDPRQWISIGLVTAGNETDDIVVFDEEEGQPFVRVLLEPTKVPVRARVGAQVAGNGEGDWHPFVEGDEVLVAIPEGDERAGCVILARLSNGIDKFPMESVAGQDPTTNTFAFSRRRTPRVEEVNGPIMWRSAMSEALISLDTAGVFTVRTGDRSVFQMSPDVIGFQGPSDESTPPEFMMQMNLTDRHLSFTVGDTLFNLSDSAATPEPNNMLKVATPFSLSTNGNMAGEHAMSVENFANIIVGFLPIINPLVFTTPAQADALLAAAILAATSSGPWTAALATQSAIALALQSQPQKLIGNPVSGLAATPGIMSAGLQIG
jgi:hypothetical protein